MSRTDEFEQEALNDLKRNIGKISLKALNKEGTHGRMYDEVMSIAERDFLMTIMEYYRHNQSEVAKVLGINRGTLRKKLKKYRYFNNTGAGL